MAKQSADVIIIGAGVIGLMSAWFFSQQNKKVIVIDKQRVGREASWAGGGILSPLHPWRYPEAVTELARWSQEYYPWLDQRLKEKYQSDMEYLRCGFYMQTTSEAEQAEKWARDQSYELQVLGQQQAKQQLAVVNWNDSPVVYMPSIGQTRNPRLLQGLQRAVCQLGVEIIEHQKVAPLANVEKLTTLKIDGMEYQADQYLVACGAWAPKVLPQLTFENVFPVRGQMLQIQTPPGFLESMVMRGARYLIPRQDGKLIVGSTIEYEDYRKFPTLEGRFDLHQSALELVPELEQFPIINHWAGLRPGSPDGVPIMDRVAGSENVFVCAGHFRNGLITAPASARHITEVMNGQQTSLPASWYAWPFTQG